MNKEFLGNVLGLLEDIVRRGDYSGREPVPARPALRQAADAASGEAEGRRQVPDRGDASRAKVTGRSCCAGARVAIARRRKYRRGARSGQ